MGNEPLSKLEVLLGVNFEDGAKKLKDSQKNFREFGQQLTQIGGELTKAFTLPIAGAATAVLAFSDKARVALASFASSTQKSLGAVGDDLVETFDIKGKLKVVSDGIGHVAKLFVDLPTPVKAAIVSFGLFVAAIGPAVLVAGKLAIAMGAVKAAMLGPVGILIGVGAAAAGFTAWHYALDQSSKSLDEIGSATISLSDKLHKQIREIDTAIDSWKKYDAAKADALHDQAHVDNTPFTKRVQRNVLTGGGADFVGPMQVQKNAEIARLEADKQGALSQLNADAMSGYSGFSMQEQLAQTDIGQKLRDIESLKQAQIEANAEMERGVELASTFGFQLADAFRNVVPLSLQIAESIRGVFDQLTQGVSNAIAQAIVYGESFKKLMSNILKQVLASIISTFVQMAIQYIIGAIAGRVYAAAVGSANIGMSVARSGAAAYASVWETVGWPVALGLAPAMAAEASAGATAAALSGKAMGMGVGAFAEGGFATGPMIATLAERGKPEAIMSEENFRRIMPGLFRGFGGAQVIHTHVHVDGREIGQAAAEYLPWYLRSQGLDR